jgi:hypothetical protein
VIDMFIATRPVYVIRNDPNELTQLRLHYTLSPLGPGAVSNVYRVYPGPASASVGAVDLASGTADGVRR